MSSIVLINRKLDMYFFGFFLNMCLCLIQGLFTLKESYRGTAHDVSSGSQWNTRVPLLPQHELTYSSQSTQLYYLIIECMLF